MVREAYQCENSRQQSHSLQRFDVEIVSLNVILIQSFFFAK